METTREIGPTSRIHVKVISLAESERRAYMADQLTRLGGNWSFFDACRSVPDGLTYTDKLARKTRGRTLSRGEIGCFASHYTLWQLLLNDTSLEGLIILEDDVCVNIDFLKRFIETAESGAVPYDYIRLYGKYPARIVDREAFLDRHIIEFGWMTYGTQGYYIGRKSAEKFMSSISAIQRPIDDEMDRFWANGVPVRAIFPFPLFELQLGSTIEGTRRKLDPPLGADRIQWMLTRIKEKIWRNLAIFSRILKGKFLG